MRERVLARTRQGHDMQSILAARSRTRKRERGQSLTEFALIAPLLFALVLGVFDVGRGMSADVTVTNSAREGARFLAARAAAWQGSAPSGQGRFDTACPTGAPKYTTAPVSGTAQGAAWRQMQNAKLDLSQVTMIVRFYNSSSDPASGAGATDTLTCSAGSVVESNGSYTPQAGDWVQFEVSYKYAPATPALSSIAPTITLDQTTTMVLE